VSASAEDAARSRGRPVAVLRLPAFRRLLLGTAVSRFGNGLATVALAFAMLDLTRSVAALGLVIAARSVANVALLLLGGALADRLPRRPLLVVSAVVSGAAQLGVAAVVAAHLDLVALVAGLAALNGAAAAVAQPLTTALVPQTLTEDVLHEGNTLFRIGTNTASLVGTGVAGAGVAVLGSAVVVGADGVTFLLAALIWSGLRVARLPRTERTSLFADIAAGWHAFRTRRWLWTVVVAFTIANAAYAGAVNVLGPVYADRALGRAVWGLALAAITAGFVLGGFVALKVRPRRPLAVAVCCAAPFGAVPALVVLVGVPGVLVVALLLVGAATEVFEVLWQTEQQRRVPAELLARVTSYDMLGSFLAIPVGQALAAPIASLVGLRPALLGAGVIGVVALVSCLLVRDVRRPATAAD
jgi:MFS family permease